MIEYMLMSLKCLLFLRSSEIPVTSSSHPSYNRSFSTPSISQGENVAASIWDIDPGTTTMPTGSITAAELENTLKVRITFTDVSSVTSLAHLSTLCSW